MAPRAAVRSIIGDDAEMQSLGFAKIHLYASEAPDPVSRDYRWGVIRFLDRTKTFGTHSWMPMEVWVYQPREMGKDYGVLDAAMARVRELIVEAEQFPGADGWTLSGATWDMESADLTDDGFNALVKFSRFRVAGRPIVAP